MLRHDSDWSASQLKITVPDRGTMVRPCPLTSVCLAVWLHVPLWIDNREEKEAIVFQRAGSILSASAGSWGEGRTLVLMMMSSSQPVSIYQQGRDSRNCVGKEEEQKKPKRAIEAWEE